jgi:transposase
MAKTKTKTYPKHVQTAARRLARHGRTDRQISRAIDVGRRTVKEWTAPEREARRRGRARRLSELGYDVREIAARMDATMIQVRSWLSGPNGRQPGEHDSGARHGTDTRRCCRRMADHKDPVAHMASVLCVTPKTVRTWLREVEAAEDTQLLPGGPRRHHDRDAILADVKATDERGNPKYTRMQIREKYGCSHKFLSHLVNGHLDE